MYICYSTQFPETREMTLCMVYGLFVFVCHQETTEIIAKEGQ